MGKQNRSTQDIINTDLKAIYPAYYQWLIQYQHRHPEMRINNGGFAIKIRQEHVDRIEKIFEIREQERDNDHTFSNALLRLSY